MYILIYIKQQKLHVPGKTCILLDKKTKVQYPQGWYAEPGFQKSCGNGGRVVKERDQEGYLFLLSCPVVSFSGPSLFRLGHPPHLIPLVSVVLPTPVMCCCPCWSWLPQGPSFLVVLHILVVPPLLFGRGTPVISLSRPVVAMSVSSFKQHLQILLVMLTAFVVGDQRQGDVGEGLGEMKC